MNEISIQARKNKTELFFGLICISMGAVILIFENWEGWIWVAIGIIFLVLKYAGHTNQDIVVNDDGIVPGKKTFKWQDIENLVLSVDFASVKLKKRKYNMLLPWFSDEDRLNGITDMAVKKGVPCEIEHKESDSGDSQRRTCLKSNIYFFVYSLYFFFLCAGIFYIDSKNDMFWLLSGIILILLTIVFIWFARKTANRFHKTLDYQFYRILDNIFFVSLLYFCIAVTIRFVYEPAEIDQGIRGIVTMMWLSPFLIFNFMSIVKNNK